MSEEYLGQFPPLIELSTPFQELGFQAEKLTVTDATEVLITIEGMTCASCVHLIEVGSRCDGFHSPEGCLLLPCPFERPLCQPEQSLPYDPTHTYLTVMFSPLPCPVSDRGTCRRQLCGYFTSHIHGSHYIRLGQDRSPRFSQVSRAWVAERSLRLGKNILFGVMVTRDPISYSSLVLFPSLG